MSDAETTFPCPVCQCTNSSVIFVAVPIEYRLLNSGFPGAFRQPGTHILAHVYRFALHCALFLARRCNYRTPIMVINQLRIDMTI